MNLEKAEKITKIVNQLKNIEYCLKALQRSYMDEFEIHYRGGLACEMEPECVELLVSHYETKKAHLENELNQL